MDYNEIPKYHGNSTRETSVEAPSVATAGPVRKVALYICGGTVPHPAGGSSQLAQQTSIENYCRKRGLSIVAGYCDKTSDSRQAWGHLIQDATKGGFDAVVVESISRLGRELPVCRQRIHALHSLGVRLIIHSSGDLSEPPDHTAIGKIQSLFDEYNAREMSAHISKKMGENTRRGFFNGGIAPYGYHPVPMGAGPDMHRKRVTPRADEAAVVRTIFALFLVGHGSNGPMSITELTKWLNDRGHRNRKGRRWNAPVVRKILKNPIYKGELRRKKKSVENTMILVRVPPVVSPQAFAAAQSRLNR